MIAVLVLGHVETFDPTGRAARRHHRDFSLEWDEGLEDRRLPASRSGVRWAEMTRASYPIRQVSKVSAACSRVAQSDWLL